METNIKELHRRIESLESARAAFVMVLAVLLQTHPRRQDFELLLTSLLERQMNGGALGQGLTPQQRADAQEMVEWLQAVQQIGPLGPQSTIQRFLKPHAGAPGGDTEASQG